MVKALQYIGSVDIEVYTEQSGTEFLNLFHRWKRSKSTTLRPVLESLSSANFLKKMFHLLITS